MLFNQNLVKEIASQLLQKTIYLTDDELQNAAHAYFIKNHNNLFKRFKKETQQTVYYKKNVTSYVSFKLYYIN